MSTASIDTTTVQALFPAELHDRLSADGLLAVLTVENESDAIPVAEALLEGGISSMELAWRTPASLRALKTIVRKVPGMLAGVGTLLSPDQIHAAQDAGAAFGVSPGLSVRMLEAARETEFPYAPGIMTPSDIQVAAEYGCRFLKFFPAESGGGLKHLKNINAPFKHLNLRYIVLGGLNENNFHHYVAEPSVSVIGGSWIASSESIKAKDWDGIRARAVAARRIVNEMRTN